MLVECPSHIDDLGGRAVDFRVKVNTKAHAIHPAQNCVALDTEAWKKTTLFYVSSFIKDILDMIGSVIASFCAIRPNLPKSQINCANRIKFLATIAFFSQWLLSSLVGAGRVDYPNVGIIHEVAIRWRDEKYYSHVRIFEEIFRTPIFEQRSLVIFGSHVQGFWCRD